MLRNDTISTSCCFFSQIEVWFFCMCGCANEKHRLDRIVLASQIEVQTNKRRKKNNAKTTKKNTYILYDFANVELLSNHETKFKYPIRIKHMVVVLVST